MARENHEVRNDLPCLAGYGIYMDSPSGNMAMENPLFIDDFHVPRLITRGYWCFGNATNGCLWKDTFSVTLSSMSLNSRTKLPSGYLTVRHGSHGPFIDGLPIKHGDFPWLCYNHRVHVYRHVPMLCATRLRRTRLPGAQPLHVHV